MRRQAWVLVALVGGCFTTDLDPTKGGVFACSDEPEGECADGQDCVNGRCEASSELPTVQIGFPEDEQDIGLGVDTPLGGRRTLNITMSGTLDLAPAGDDDVFGEGHLEVIVDGQEPLIVESGALSAIVQLDVVLDNTIGAHRISVRAIRNDGTRYDHAAGSATRLFWISDGVTPLIGIKRPWPGSEFPLEATPIEVEAAVLNFSLQAANPTGGVADKTGHAHVYYARDILPCIMDADGCDKQYLTTIVMKETPGQLTIPDTVAGSFPISVVLRNINHSLYLFDSTPDDDVDEGVPIVDEVAVTRR